MIYSLDICHLYPNLLNTYGDYGNIIALKQRAFWRGIQVNVHNISINDNYQYEKYDITFLGGGQNFEQEIIQNDLIQNKGSSIKEAINAGYIFLAICGGYQLLGEYYKLENNTIHLLDAINICTIAENNRLVGDLAFYCDFLKSDTFDGIIVGFENHSGRTFLGPHVKPLGKIIYGNGNNGTDGFEGAIFKNTFCSYSHGSLLPKNPEFTDYILSLALQRKYKDSITLSPLDNSLENNAKLYILNKLKLTPKRPKL